MLGDSVDCRNLPSSFELTSIGCLGDGSSMTGVVISVGSSGGGGFGFYSWSYFVYDKFFFPRYLYGDKAAGMFCMGVDRCLRSMLLLAILCSSVLVFFQIKLFIE